MPEGPTLCAPFECIERFEADQEREHSTPPAEASTRYTHRVGGLGIVDERHPLGYSASLVSNPPKEHGKRTAPPAASFPALSELKASKAKEKPKTRASKRGIYEDLYTTAMMHATGVGGKQDLDKARDLLERSTSIDMGSVPKTQQHWVALAHNALGISIAAGAFLDMIIVENTKTADIAGGAIAPSAESSNAPQVIAKDLDKALKHYQLAASFDDPSAIFNMGICHAEGIGTAVNNELALRELHRAAERNCPAAQCYLAKVYAGGTHGVERNLCLARELLARAMENGVRRQRKSWNALRQREK
ncbi:hypothetical protein BC829DRAFT_22351 [Chytridium lagenaria]|nr:hypothetical protein BC829DRAFT_22351 [Chytridium lagenaria]